MPIVHLVGDDALQYIFERIADQLPFIIQLNARLSKENEDSSNGPSFPDDCILTVLGLAEWDLGKNLVSKSATANCASTLCPLLLVSGVERCNQSDCKDVCHVECEGKRGCLLCSHFGNRKFKVCLPTFAPFAPI